MSSRTPRPRTPPTTLRGLVLDLDDRLEGGDALDEVVLPHDEWVPLVEAAQAEHERALDASGFRGSETKGALCRTLGISENSTDTELFLAVKKLAHPPPPEESDRSIADLIKPKDEDRHPGGFLKAPPEVHVWRTPGDNGEGEVVRVRLILGGEGCVIEPSVARRLIRNISAGLQEAECRHCGGGHDSDRCKSKSKPKDRLPPRGGKRSLAERAGPAEKAATVHPKPKAKKKAPFKKEPAKPKVAKPGSRFTPPFQIRVGLTTWKDRFSDRTLAVAFAKAEKLSSFKVVDYRGRVTDMVDLPLPKEKVHTVVHRGSRKAKKPAAKEPVQTTLEESIDAAASKVKAEITVERPPSPPTRATKKFPLQSGSTEKCTECGAEQGDHAGTKCPFPATPPPVPAEIVAPHQEMQ